MSDTLILNADGQPLSYIPISAVHWHISVKLIWLEKARILEEYSDWTIHSPTTEILVPSVMILKQYMRFNTEPKFSRFNVHLRDLFTCQYCGCEVDMHKGTLDHVLPRSYKGPSTWENVVTACQPCNTRKGNNPRILPKKSPYKPNIHELTNKRKRYPVQLKTPNWNRYLNWPEDLIKVA